MHLCCFCWNSQFYRWITEPSGWQFCWFGLRSAPLNDRSHFVPKERGSARGNVSTRGDRLSPYKFWRLHSITPVMDTFFGYPELSCGCRKGNSNSGGRESEHTGVSLVNQYFLFRITALLPAWDIANSGYWYIVDRPMKSVRTLFTVFTLNPIL